MVPCSNTPKGSSHWDGNRKKRNIGRDALLEGCAMCWQKFVFEGLQPVGDPHQSGNTPEGLQPVTWFASDSVALPISFIFTCQVLISRSFQQVWTLKCLFRKLLLSCLLDYGLHLNDVTFFLKGENSTFSDTCRWQMRFIQSDQSLQNVVKGFF